MGNNPARQKGEGRSSGIVKEGLVIQLDGRRLTEIPASIFEEEEERQKLGTGEITTGLILNFNHLSSIPPKLATTFLYLTELALAANRLASLPSEIWGLTSLVYLHLGVNKLTTISEDVGCLLALKDLNLASNKLTEVPNSLQRLSALCQLTLTGNLLTHCPSKLPQNLKTLRLGTNCLSEFPTEVIYSLAHSLTELDLCENDIRALPNELTQLSCLRYLILSCNALTSLPSASSAPTWPDLIHLDLSYNDLERFPPSLSKVAPKLQTLILFGNPFSVYPERQWYPQDRDELSELSTVCRSIECHRDDSPNQISPSVFLGSLESAKSKHILKNLGITHILCVCPFKPYYPNEFEYCKLVIDDAKSDKFMQQLPMCLDFIQSVIDSNGKVLIHWRGVSRSGAITTAFVMRQTGTSYEDALAYVKSCRACVHPKECFQEQLREWRA